MVFTVKYRKDDGSSDSLTIEAASRSEAFGILRSRGITPLKVEQGVTVKAQHRPVFVRALLAGAIVVALSLACFLFLSSSGKPADRLAQGNPRQIKEAKPTVRVRPSDGTAKTEAEKIRQIKHELNETVKEFIKKADTNNVIRIGPAPLDPDDPDNALRTRTMTEVAMLVGIEPGEPMPPVPFSFMMEDAELEEAERNGERVITFDGGNKQFAEELEKWKITIKETDSDKRAEKKRELLAAQFELRKGIDEGLTVNDSIRAAYEFRKAAYETRSEMTQLLSEMHAADPDTATSKALVDKANEKLAADGIKTISYDEVIPDYEGDESESSKQTDGSME